MNFAKQSQISASSLLAGFMYFAKRNRHECKELTPKMKMCATPPMLPGKGIIKVISQNKANSSSSSTNKDPSIRHDYLFSEEAKFPPRAFWLCILQNEPNFRPRIPVAHRASAFFARPAAFSSPTPASCVQTPLSRLPVLPQSRRLN